jgi:hypothetical protein
MRAECQFRYHWLSGLQIEGVLAYFTHLKYKKCIEDDVGRDVGYVFTKKIKMFL